MNREQVAEALRQNQVVAYPTEAVFGLGCNPQSESAVKKLNEIFNNCEVIDRDKGYWILQSSKLTG